MFFLTFQPDDGHTLDLLITRSSSTFVTHLSQHESYQSDHKSFTFKFYPHTRPPTERTPYNTAPTKPLMLTISKVTSSLPLSTQTQHPMHPTWQINFPPPSNPFSTSMPNQIQTVVQRPHTPWINPEILQAKRERSRLERCWRRWKSPFDRMKIPSSMQLSPIPHFQSQILIFVQSCNRIIRQSSHTLENPQHNSSPKPFKLTSRVPRCTIPGQHIP